MWPAKVEIWDRDIEMREIADSYGKGPAQILKGVCRSFDGV